MKREQLLKHWTVIKAFRNGKQVQVLCLPGEDNLNPGWVDTSSPTFDLYLEYRIKPEKKVGWLNIYPNDEIRSIRLWPTKEDADRVAGSPQRIACIRVEYEEGEGL